ncbi:MAG: hypothetical protein K2K87_09565 [Lachnospiraceae bacterium]|nr:hypothetical protein [Lachnospiraceae bacterium]
MFFIYKKTICFLPAFDLFQIGLYNENEKDYLNFEPNKISREKSDMSNWRAPNGDEYGIILEWGKKIYHKKRTFALTMGVIGTCTVLFFSILFSWMAARGKGWDSGWLIFGCIATLIILFICGMIRFVNKKKLQMLAQRKYCISEARAMDKREYTYRSYYSNAYLRVKWQSGLEREYRVGITTYEQISFETNLIAIKYHNGMHGFFDLYDFVPVPK